MRRNAATKANETRAARKAFYKKYPKSARYVELLLRNQSGNYRNYTNRYRWDLTEASEAAVLANLNRPGTFQDMAFACNW